MPSPVADSYVVGSGASMYVGRFAPTPPAPPPPPPPPPAPSPSPAPTPSADWVTRSTATGVQWSHDFTSATEVTAHLQARPSDGSSVGPGTDPARVSDPEIGWAMRTYALGARLTADFLAAGGAGPRALQIDDATYWPDPAVVGPYYVHLCKPFGDQQNNLVLVTARSGTTLTVAYQSSVAGFQPFATSQRDWFIGDHVGGQNSSTWCRHFTALKADSSGRGTNDRGTPLRSFFDQTNFPWGPQTFGYGWYGHSTYQAAYPNWRPSDQGAAGVDSILRQNVWDGGEFYLQWRMKIDPRFLLNEANFSNDNRFGRKVWMLQTNHTVPQQITGGMSPGNTQFQIPQTPETMHVMAGYSFAGGLAGRVMGSIITGAGGGSFQPGGPYAAAQYGDSTLRPGDAWETPVGEWVTFHLHVKPGLKWSRDNPTATGVRNTTLEMQVARQGDTAYTTVFSMTDQAIVFGSSGPEEDVWTSALPGYNAINFTGYLNVDLGNVPPMRSYALDFGQVIFSKQPIAPPAPILPDWVAAPGDVTVMTTANGKLTNTFGSVLPVWFSAFYGSKIVNDYSGGIPNPYYGTYGAVVWDGAGHAASNDNSVVMLVLNKTGATFQLAVAGYPTYGNTAAAAGANDTTSDGTPYANLWCEYPDGNPSARHSYGAVDVIGPGEGGATYGTVLRLFEGANGQAGTNLQGYVPHALHFNSLLSPGQTTNYVRHGTLGGNIGTSPFWQAHARAQKRIYLHVAHLQQVRWFDLVTKTYVIGTGGALTDNSDPYFGSIDGGAFISVPERELILFADLRLGQVRFRWLDVSRTNTQPSWDNTGASLSSAITPPDSRWNTVCWCPDNKRLILGHAGDMGAVYEIQIPLVLTDTWTVTRVPLPGGKTILFAGETGFKTWTYNPKVRSIVWMQYADSSNANDTVYAYRPRNT